MGQKDLREKLLEDYEDVFSDIFNVLVFKDNVIKKQYLRASATESVYKSETKEYRGQYRDVLKEYTDNCLLEIGSLGIENQSTLDDYIPVRIMGYDYAKYRSQIDRNEYPLLPVITIVLNFSNKPWKESKNIHSIMKIPDEFQSYVSDYKVMVFDIAFLEDEIMNLGNRMKPRNEKKRPAIVLTTALLLMYLISGILLVLLAMLLLNMEMSEASVKIGVIVTYIISGFIGGFFIGKQMQDKKYLWGMAGGAIYFVLLVLLSILIKQGMGETIQAEPARILTTMLLCAVSAMAGGMFS